MTSRERQERHIKAWQVSGVSQAAYCRETGLNAKTFGNWLRSYRQGQNDNQPVALIPVTIKSGATAAGLLRLCCSDGYILDIPADVSPQWLAEVLRCLN